MDYDPSFHTGYRLSEHVCACFIGLNPLPLASTILLSNLFALHPSWWRYNKLSGTGREESSDRLAHTCCLPRPFVFDTCFYTSFPLVCCVCVCEISSSASVFAGAGLHRVYSQNSK